MYVKLDNDFDCQFSPAYHTKRSNQLSESLIYSTCEFILVKEGNDNSNLGDMCNFKLSHELRQSYFNRASYLHFYHKFCAT